MSRPQFTLSPHPAAGGDRADPQPYHESLDNVTLAGADFGGDKAILRKREKIKKHTIRQRGLQHQKQAA